MDAILAALAKAMNTPAFALVVGLLIAGWFVALRSRLKSGSTGGGAETKRFSDGDLISGMLAPGGLLYERSEGRRPIMEHHGLKFCYSVYQAPEGTSPFSLSAQSASAKRQLEDLGGPFQSLRVSQPLRDVYEGSFDGVKVTIGNIYWAMGGGRGHATGTYEQMAAIVALPHAVLGTFATAAIGFGGEKLRFPSHPQLDKTHRIRGNEAARNVLGEAVLDLLANEPNWKIEGKDDKLVIRGVTSPRDQGLSDEEITQFADGVFRIAELFGARFTQSSPRSFSTADRHETDPTATGHRVKAPATPFQSIPR